MACSCIVKGYFNFHLSSITNEALIYEDASVWATGEDYVFPTTYSLDIKTPVGAIYTVEVNASGKNRIDSTTLGLGANLTFMDGIYCFTLENCGKIYSKSKAYTPNSECCILNLLSRAKTDIDFEIIQRLSFYLKSVHINSELKKEELATEFFQKLQKEFQLLNCNCDGL
jgi:hypothetical protein